LAAGTLTTPRYGHTATLIPQGTQVNGTGTALAHDQVLITGGTDGNGNPLATAELYDDGSKTITALTSTTMVETRTGHAATLLATGQVLVAGGGPAGQPFDPAEVYDPIACTFTAKGDMAVPRHNSFGAPLPAGQFLVAGGDAFGSYGATLNPSAEVYDPGTGLFTSNPTAMPAALDTTLASAVVLKDGRILFAGGYAVPQGESQPQVSASLQFFAPLAPPAAANVAFTATPSTIIQGQTSTLSWIAQGSNPVLVTGGGLSQTVTGASSFPVQPATTTAYTLIVSGPGGAATPMGP
jgi:hypothetical protein